MTDRGQHVVVVGGGFGGLAAAKALGGGPTRVTLIDRHNHHLFQPLLYQVASAALAPGSIAVPIRSVVSKHRNVRVLLGEVSDVDLDAKRLELSDGSGISYDYLVIAAGAKTSFFGHDEWGQYAYGLKNLREAIGIREKVLLSFEAAEREPDPQRRRELLRFVVIGGGPTGVEMAGAISELGRTVLARDFRSIRADDVEVILVEMADRVLTPFEEELSAAAERQLRDLGVDVRTGQKVTRIERDVVTIGEERMPAACIVWASGVTPVALAGRLRVERARDGRIVVDQHCAVPSHPEVFAIGDVAAFTPSGDDRPLPGLAPVAMQQGRHVARTIRDEARGRPRRPFEYVDKGIMATIGRSRAVVQSGKLRVSGLLAWLMWCFIHVAYLIDFRNRVVVMFEWVWSYVTFKRGARLITSRDPAAPPPPEEAPDPPIERSSREGLEPRSTAP